MDANNILKEGLEILSKDSGASDLYCRGLVVGMVAGIMAAGYSFEEA